MLRLGRFLEDNLPAFGEDAIAFVSPIDVSLNDREIVQPDAVVARRAQVSSRGVEGAPPLLVEVVSPAKPGLDRAIKARRDAANGVERFWLVDPVARTMECSGSSTASFRSRRRAAGTPRSTSPICPA